jgi:hypothetical protein
MVPKTFLRRGSGHQQHQRRAHQHPGIVARALRRLSGRFHRRQPGSDVGRRLPHQQHRRARQEKELS